MKKERIILFVCVLAVVLIDRCFIRGRFAAFAGWNLVALAVGGGFFFAMNRNFIVAVEVGRPLNPQDGTLGVYMNLGFSF